MTDEGIEWTAFFQKRKTPFQDISKVESAEVQPEWYWERKLAPPVKTESGEELRPEEFYSSPFKKGVVIFLKSGPPFS